MTDVEQKGENNQSAETVTPPVDAQEKAGTPPPDEQSGSDDSGKDHKIPKRRLDEVIEQRNRERELREAYEARIRDLEMRQTTQAPQESVIDVQAKQLSKKLGIEESAAKAILEANAEVDRAERSKVEARQAQFRAEAWVRDKAQNDSDYGAIEPELDRSFRLKTPQMQAFIASNSEALEMFYDSVKSKVLGTKAKEAFMKGADEAYKTKMLKQAVSSVPGSSSSTGKKPLTREVLKELMNDPKAYKERQAEINNALEKGLLK